MNTWGSGKGEKTICKYSLCEGPMEILGISFGNMGQRVCTLLKKNNSCTNVRSCYGFGCPYRSGS